MLTVAGRRGRRVGGELSCGGLEGAAREATRALSLAAVGSEAARAAARAVCSSTYMYVYIFPSYIIPLYIYVPYVYKYVPYVHLVYDGTNTLRRMHADCRPVRAGRVGTMCETMRRQAEGAA